MPRGLCRRERGDRMAGSRLSFWTICLMHEGPLMKAFRKPERLLGIAGVAPGKTLVEVGCGPGFFTLPAARMVGDKGLVYALDVNPYAVDRVRKKIEREGLTNVRASLTNAAETGLPDNSVDVVFIFGIRYVAGGLDGVLQEAARILKPGGRLSLEKSSGSDSQLTAAAARAGFFILEAKGRLFMFTNG